MTLSMSAKKKFGTDPEKRNSMVDVDGKQGLQKVDGGWETFR